jgi:hypothetical protein
MAPNTKFYVINSNYFKQYPIHLCGWSFSQKKKAITRPNYKWLDEWLMAE